MGGKYDEVRTYLQDLQVVLAENSEFQADERQQEIRKLLVECEKALVRGSGTQGLTTSQSSAESAAVGPPVAAPRSATGVSGVSGSQAVWHSSTATGSTATGSTATGSTATGSTVAPTTSEAGSPKTGSVLSIGKRKVRKNPEDINVLIVDDDQVAAILLSNQLTKLHIRNEYVLSGWEALDRLYLAPDYFHVVLCDVNMPGLDGGQVLNRILEDQHLRHIPIVMVSADSDINRARELVSAGARDYITKPVENIALVSLSFKVNAWTQGNSSRHLSALYDISSALLMHLKVEFQPDERYIGGQTPEGAGELSPNQLVVSQAIVKVASPPMRQLLGVTDTEISRGTVDALHFVLPEDKYVLQTQIKEALLRRTDPGQQQQKLAWRWIDANGNSVPVIGSWCRIGEAEDGEILVESSSLLPSLLLKREKERRQFAERRAEEAQRRSDKLQESLISNKKTDLSIRHELTSAMCEMSEFSKMITENPHVLTWRFDVAEGKVAFISPKSCQQLLGYEAEELVGKPIEDTIHPDDVELAKSAMSTIGNSVRLRRKKKDGTYICVESRPYAWWDEQPTTVVVVTEYDISNYIRSSS